jgi:hypothetical protein
MQKGGTRFARILKINFQNQLPAGSLALKPIKNPVEHREVLRRGRNREEAVFIELGYEEY